MLLFFEIFVKFEMVDIKLKKKKKTQKTEPTAVPAQHGALVPSVPGRDPLPGAFSSPHVSDVGVPAAAWGGSGWGVSSLSPAVPSPPHPAPSFCQHRQEGFHLWAWGSPSLLNWLTASSGGGSGGCGFGLHPDRAAGVSRARCNCRRQGFERVPVIRPGSGHYLGFMSCNRCCHRGLGAATCCPDEETEGRRQG